MKVTDTFYSVKAPHELQERLSDLCAISCYAKSLGLNDLSKQAKEAYFNLSGQWDEQAKKEAKKKSAGWFLQVIGGGSYYSVDSSNKWEEIVRTTGPIGRIALPKVLHPRFFGFDRP